MKNWENSMQNLKSGELNVLTIDLKKEKNQWKRILLYVGLIFALTMLCQSVFASVNQQCQVSPQRIISETGCITSLVVSAIFTVLYLLTYIFSKKMDASSDMPDLFPSVIGAFFFMHFIFFVGPCLLN
ncbi:MAG: hypothetical protein ON057_000742 [Glomeribacter sp. 1016415]|nr:hypothetical protein [Glomeribacter sp. 1016415]